MVRARRRVGDHAESESSCSTTVYPLALGRSADAGLSEWAQGSPLLGIMIPKKVLTFFSAVCDGANSILLGTMPSGVTSGGQLHKLAGMANFMLTLSCLSFGRLDSSRLPFPFSTSSQFDSTSMPMCERLIPRRPQHWRRGMNLSYYFFGQ